MNFVGRMKEETLPPAEDEIKTEEDEAFLRAQIEARLGWEYPYSAETDIPGTVSVSDVKRLRGIRLSHSVRTPDFYTGEKGLTAAERGTAVHTVLQHMDLGREYDYDSVRELIKECAENGILTEAEAQSVSIRKIELFASSPLYKRILKADKVFREEAFTVAVSPGEIYSGEKYADVDGDMILHGRIDCCFVENGEIVLIDYKTDRYNEDSEEEFHQRYDIQMELYSKALEKVTGLRVKECYIYSVESGKAIAVDLKEA